MINIQSFSGIITNSSTEVFMLFNRHCVEGLKKVVENIIHVSNPNYSFDDLFEFGFEIDDYAVEVIYDDYKDYTILSNKTFNNEQELSDYLHSLSLEELYEIQEDFDSNSWDCSTRFFCGLNIKPKTNVPSHAVAANAINSIVNLFELDYTYG